MTLVLDTDSAAPELAEAPLDNFAPQVADACRRIPPLWPLKNFVAVNPFVGLSDRTFLDTCALMRRVAHGDITMPLSYYRQQWEAGRISETNLQQALEQARQTLSAEHAVLAENFNVESLKTALSSTQPNAPDDSAVLTVADVADRLHGTQWSAFIIDEISKWCSAYYDQGQASWRMPWRDEKLYKAWKGAALCDANPEMMGLRGFRKTVAALPDNAPEAIEYSLKVLGVPRASAADFLHRQLMTISGWSGYAQYQVREKALYGHEDDSLQQLLAIRLAYEVGLHHQYNDANFAQIWTQNIAALQGTYETPSELVVRYLWQLAAENSYQSQLLSDIKTANAGATQGAAAIRSAVQAVFCIDVRSEVFRRSLEAASPEIETRGFAGFFGFPVEYVPFGQRHGTTQCPVLIAPKFRIRESLPHASWDDEEAAFRKQLFSKRLARSWNSFKTSAVSCFSFVETGGLLSGVKIIKDSFGLHHEEHSPLAPRVAYEDGSNAQATAAKSGHEHRHLHQSGMKLDEQVAVAAGALKNMGLISNFARIVMICGHGSSTVNNPYGSGLDCGACGGHSGEANARVAATVLNNPQVRAGLVWQGIEIPEDTHFVAALHNTTTDDVTLFDAETVPATHKNDIKNLLKWLQNASAGCRLQRAFSLGLGDTPQDEIDEQVRARSYDWAQVRPEWGLAGNASFIVAPRERTKTLQLGGRTFLNNYDYRTDDDNALLQLVLTAPVVVASWISLQYFASTVNNSQFGSGNKTIHNVVGTMGVWQGNSGDLKVGLPLQSVHDGEKWVHEPLRLSVLIEAPRHKINSVLEAHDNVRELFDNGWLHLIAIEDDGQNFARYCGDLHWKNIDGDVLAI